MDHNIEAHKLCAYAIVVFTGIHFLAHLFNVLLLSDSYKSDKLLLAKLNTLFDGQSGWFTIHSDPVRNLPWPDSWLDLILKINLLTVNQTCENDVTLPNCSFVEETRTYLNPIEESDSDQIASVFKKGFQNAITLCRSNIISQT